MLVLGNLPHSGHEPQSFSHVQSSSHPFSFVAHQSSQSVKNYIAVNTMNTFQIMHANICPKCSLQGIINILPAAAKRAHVHKIVTNKNSMGAKYSRAFFSYWTSVLLLCLSWLSSKSYPSCCGFLRWCTVSAECQAIW